MICLTRQELEELTGYQRPTGQIKWLNAYAIPFFIGMDGYPRVLRTALEIKQLAKKTGPDFTKLPARG